MFRIYPRVYMVCAHQAFQSPHGVKHDDEQQHVHRVGDLDRRHSRRHLLLHQHVEPNHIHFIDISQGQGTTIPATGHYQENGDA